MHAHPGPIHCEGDLLTLEINAGECAGSLEGPTSLQVDDRDPYEVTGEWQGNYLLVPLDTEGLAGNHQLTIRAEQDGVRVDEAYHLEVRPAMERPAQAQDPEWAVREPHRPAHVATEHLNANAQQALVEGSYDDAETLIAAMKGIATSGRLDQPLAREYGAATYALAQRGYLIDGRERYGILWQEQSESTYLGAEGMQRSEAINPAGEPNVLRAVCTGETLSFGANGQELLTAENTVRRGSGDAGFVVNTAGGAPLDVAYDYLLVTEP